MSLGEIPLVFALLFAGGFAAMLAGALGRVFVLALHRKLPPIRLAFNFGVFLLGNCVAVLVFHAIAGAATAITPTVWVAAMLATVVGSLVVVLLDQRGRVAVRGSAGHPSGRSLAADRPRRRRGQYERRHCARRRLLYEDWQVAILMAIPVAGMFISFQAYVSERQRHDRVEFLYRAARELSRSPEIGPALEGLLAQALDAFRAEVAEIIFFSPDGKDALRTAVRRRRRRARFLRAVEPDGRGALPVAGRGLRRRSLRHVRDRGRAAGRVSAVARPRRRDARRR